MFLFYSFSNSGCYKLFCSIFYQPKVENRFYVQIFKVCANVFVFLINFQPEKVLEFSGSLFFLVKNNDFQIMF